METAIFFPEIIKWLKKLFFNIYVLIFPVINLFTDKCGCVRSFKNGWYEKCYIATFAVSLSKDSSPTLETPSPNLPLGKICRENLFLFWLASTTSAMLPRLEGWFLGIHDPRLSSLSLSPLIKITCIFSVAGRGIKIFTSNPPPPHPTHPLSLFSAMEFPI